VKKDKLREYAKLIRLPALGMSLTSVFGALSVKGYIEISHLLILFTTGALATLASFVLNDYADVEIDKQSRYSSERPLVKGSVSKKTAFIISILCLIIGMGLVFVFFRRLLPITVVTISVVLGTVYNLFGKKFVGGGFFVAGAVAFSCLFGATTVSDDIGGITWVIVGLFFTLAFFRNAIEGSLKDVNKDREVGAKTIAVYLGVKTNEKMHISKGFKALAISLRSASAFLIFIPFIILRSNYEFTFWYLQILLLIILTVGIFVWTVKMLNMRLFNREALMRDIIHQEVASGFFVPIMLMSLIGITWTLFLIILPIAWYLTFTLILHEKPFTLPSDKIV